MHWAGRSRWAGDTHTPLEGIPSQEPARECGGLVSLLHHNDEGLRVPAAGVGLEVFLHRGGCSFLLGLIGILSNPEKDLWSIPESVLPVLPRLPQAQMSRSGPWPWAGLIRP